MSSIKKKNEEKNLHRAQTIYLVSFPIACFVDSNCICNKM